MFLAYHKLCWSHQSCKTKFTKTLVPPLYSFADIGLEKLCHGFANLAIFRTNFCQFQVQKNTNKLGIVIAIEMARSGSRHKDISKKPTLDYKEVYEELVNQNQIPIKMTETKKALNILEANFDRKIDKMSNVLLEKLQKLIDKTFGSAEMNHRSISDDGYKNKCPHEIGILNDKMQSLEVENSFVKNEIHELTTLLNAITTSLSCKLKNTEMENTLHEKSDCQEVVIELSNVNCCTDNLTHSNAMDHQLPSLHNATNFLTDTASLTKKIKNKNVIQEIKNSCTKISPNNGNENNKDYLCDSGFRSSVQINQSSTCIDIETILK